MVPSVAGGSYALEFAEAKRKAPENSQNEVLPACLCLLLHSSCTYAVLIPVWFLRAYWHAGMLLPRLRDAIFVFLFLDERFFRWRGLA